MARGGCGAAAATAAARQHLVYRATETLPEFTIARSRNLGVNNFSIVRNVLCAGVNCALPVDRIICSHARYSAAAATQHRNTHHRVDFAANGLILPFLVLSSSKSSMAAKFASPGPVLTKRKEALGYRFGTCRIIAPGSSPAFPFSCCVCTVRPTFCSGHFPLVNRERKLDFGE